MKKVTVLALGGSNTVMRPGYLTELPRCLQKHGIDMTLSANLSVGNTSIFMGLMQLKMNVEAISRSDVMLIEYTLNDTGFFSASLQRVGEWAKGMEAVIRFARLTNPKIKIIPIIFATQTGIHRNGINPLHAGVHYLASYYGIRVVDVNAELVSRFGVDFHDIPGAYQDPAHYQRPLITTLAAEIVAEKSGDYLRSHVLPSNLPPQICAGRYTEANIVTHAQVVELDTANFKNYLYDETTYDLTSGSITLEIEGGTILATKYVCTDDAAQLFLNVNGKWFQTQTMQPGMVEPKYKFLLSMLSFDGLPASEGINNITLTAVRPEGVEISPLPQPGAKPPVRDEKRLPIAAILHTGKLVGFKVSRADQRLTDTAA
ncbi:hypothetical protein [Paracoccus laeviglucosivorans]|uniref:Lysophospholipase L1 n=1 Tax=Paracoccus laeviglucosivorans TaxID=1197861 RepID=A0A521D5H6_9RHOB|nr:hypothetical protein [Paracoccus laeviglucosivorans]SMO66939.1 hypothetical protein SAMN06265221_106127 [Paracoccus laeviglucosivorans]